MAKRKTVDTVRQFLYLDTEQVRSFVAQIERGLPEKQEKVVVRRSTSGARYGVKIGKVQLRIKDLAIWTAKEDCPKKCLIGFDTSIDAQMR